MKPAPSVVPVDEDPFADDGDDDLSLFVDKAGSPATAPISKSDEDIFGASIEAAGSDEEFGVSILPLVLPDLPSYS